MVAPTNKMALVKIDGSTGEGGGQIIRTALALSMLTNTPIEVTNIRAGRSKPGLMRQHHICVQASKLISNAVVTGDQIGSAAFSFVPSGTKAGDYTFDIGSAGSTSLVMQTVLPALLFADSDNTSATSDNDASSTVTVKGGTHNPLAPTSDFLRLAFVPVLTKLGMQLDIELRQAGYAPVGGGEVTLTVKPYLRLAVTPALSLIQRYELLSIELVASHLNLDNAICLRELTCVTETLIESGIDETLITTQVNRQTGIGEGNSCYAVVTHSLKDTYSSNEQSCVQVHTEVFSLLGSKRQSAEKVGKRLAGLIKRYVFKTEALVDEYLTDQLLLPLALADGGEFSARTISEHTKTQAWLIEQFLPVSIEFETLKNHTTLVKVIC